MTLSLPAVLVAVLCILPGLVGEWIYQIVVGKNWLEKEWRSLLRLLAFSMAGAAIYSGVASLLGWRPLVHLLPSTFEQVQGDPKLLNALFLPYLGHVTGGTLAGILAGAVRISISKVSAQSPFPAPWDDFVRTYAAERWVIVGIETGDVYAGRLATANLSVGADERDFVLGEPCLYDEQKNAYVALNYQYLFLKAASVYSIAAVYDARKDHCNRLVRVGEHLFTETQVNEQEEASSTASAATQETARSKGRLAPSAS